MDNIDTRALVCNESEMCILGTCLSNNNLMNKVFELINISDFALSYNKNLFTCMTELFANGESFDYMVLYTKYWDVVNSNGGLSYLSDLIGYNNISTLEHHIKNVKRLSSLRKLVGMKNVLKKCFQDNMDPGEVIEDVNNVINNINTSSAKKILTMADVTEMTLEEIEIAHNSLGSVGKSTGFYKLDDMLNGLKAQDYIVIGARPSMGKTAFILSILNNLKEDTNALLVQCDMSLTAIGSRMLGMTSYIQSGKISRGRLSDDEFTKVAQTSAYLAAKPNLFFMDESNPVVTDIYNRAKALKETKGLDVLIVDHIGKLQSSLTNCSDDYKNMSNVSNWLKKLAKDLNVCVIALCQLSRKVEMRADKRPILADLRDSGKIEEDADIIGFLYRDGYYSQRESGAKIDKDLLEFDCQKNRDGKIGRLYYDYYLSTQIIQER